MTMKVLHVIDTLEVGGAEESTLQIAGRFRQTELVMVHLYPGRTLAPRYESVGVRVVSLDRPGRLAPGRGVAELARLVRSADLVVLPYQSVDQVTSGVLVEAISASKPVIATSFPHSIEVLSGGAGMLVPHGDVATAVAAAAAVAIPPVVTPRIVLDLELRPPGAAVYFALVLEDERATVEKGRT